MSLGIGILVVGSFVGVVGLLGVAAFTWERRRTGSKEPILTS